jgi:hypothetical protein
VELSNWGASALACAAEIDDPFAPSASTNLRIAVVVEAESLKYTCGPKRG